MSLLYFYAHNLPEMFFKPLSPSPLPDPKLLKLNIPLTHMLGLNPNWLRSPEGIALLSYGKRPDNKPPIAMSYAGHQFGHFNPSLGDGRAMLVGEINLTEGTLYDIHLKGSGCTPFSRGGDGQYALGPALREYIVSEAMAALNIPTSRTLSLLTTGRSIYRDNRLVPGAIIARIAKSHIRIGTFQYAAARGDISAIRTLADITIKRLFPKIDINHPKRYHLMLKQFLQHQAKLMSQWMGIGFIHGVINTDNCALSGETLDYGPCAFLDDYDPQKTFSFIDQSKRYSYSNQPKATFWNICRLAECLLPLINANENIAVKETQDILQEFDTHFHLEWLKVFRRKLGLEKEYEKDSTLIHSLLNLMKITHADFTQTFRSLSQEKAVLNNDYSELYNGIEQNKEKVDDFLSKLLKRLSYETRSPNKRYLAMQNTNPRTIPRNHHINHVITEAENGNMEPFQRLQKSLQNPFSSFKDEFSSPPKPNERVQHTFCGT